LQNTISYKPGGLLGDFTWCESHGWTKNDSVVIFSMNSEGQHEKHMDIYTLNIYDSILVRLTDEPQTWDEHAQLAENGTKFIFICSTPYDFDSTRAQETLKTDYWIMNIDGTNKQRVTFFNDPSHSDHQIHNGKRVICADASFSPTGDSLLICTKVPDDTIENIYEKIMLAVYDASSSSIIFPEQTPREFHLHQNYPNPFNATTKITYSLAIRDIVTLKVYNTLGREVQALINEFQEANTYTVTFHPDKLTSGIYFYKLQIGTQYVKTKKMILLK
jgi:Tol biopolymer transport system component